MLSKNGFDILEHPLESGGKSAIKINILVFYKRMQDERRIT